MRNGRFPSHVVWLGRPVAAVGAEAVFLAARAFNKVTCLTWSSLPQGFARSLFNPPIYAFNATFNSSYDRLDSLSCNYCCLVLTFVCCKSQSSLTSLAQPSTEQSSPSTTPIFQLAVNDIITIKLLLVDKSCVYFWPANRIDTTVCLSPS